MYIITDALAATRGISGCGRSGSGAAMPSGVQRHNPWLIAITVTLATFMEVLDTSIANIALPHIAGSLGASTNESTWVLTSYLVSNGIVLPISAWLATRYRAQAFLHVLRRAFRGQQFPVRTGADLGMLVIFRVLQGAGGGGFSRASRRFSRILSSRRSAAWRSRFTAWRWSGAGDRPYAGRLDHRQFQLALDFLHQRANQLAFALPDARFVEDPPYC